ncbi:uncharacterized protein LOC129808913 [Phlebotomus papatasi]|uniref:uncharacterized protein LOC129808913 n=1 Tax=Phlebotomus papatasi TaxID=29031 RepID=UPI0024840750|nr:uncharacterized protein LOC129808913 [Phlebotomus papatasi]
MSSMEDGQILQDSLKFKGDSELRDFRDYFGNEVDLINLQSDVTEPPLNTVVRDPDDLNDAESGSVDRGIFVPELNFSILLEVGPEPPSESGSVLEHIQSLPDDSENNSNTIKRDKEEAENEEVWDDVKLPVRKKRAKPDSWAQNLRKASRDKGEEYVNRNGIIIP